MLDKEYRHGLESRRERIVAMSLRKSAIFSGVLPAGRHLNQDKMFQSRREDGKEFFFYAFKAGIYMKTNKTLTIWLTKNRIFTEIIQQCDDILYYRRA